MGLGKQQNGPGSKQCSFLQHGCRWSGWTHSGLPDIGVGHNFQPHFLKGKRKRNTQTLMHQKLSILYLFVHHPMGTCLSSGLAKYFFASFWSGIIQVLSNEQTRSSELSHLAWVNRIYFFSNTWSFRHYAFSACTVQLLMLWRFNMLCEIQLK